MHSTSVVAKLDTPVIAFPGHMFGTVMLSLPAGMVTTLATAMTTTAFFGISAGNQATQKTSCLPNANDHSPPPAANCRHASLVKWATP